jgi:hypothetical protein
MTEERSLEDLIKARTKIDPDIEIQIERADVRAVANLERRRTVLDRLIWSKQAIDIREEIKRETELREQARIEIEELIPVMAEAAKRYEAACEVAMQAREAYEMLQIQQLAKEGGRKNSMENLSDLRRKLANHMTRGKTE